MTNTRTKEDLDKIFFKIKVLDWLKINNAEIRNKKIRVYKYRGEWEVRIYGEPLEVPNHKQSFRTTSTEGNIKHGYRGVFSTKVASYTHINESDFENENEKKFILEVIKNV
jgi:hypothetical protein